MTGRCDTNMPHECKARSNSSILSSNDVPQILLHFCGRPHISFDALVPIITGCERIIATSNASAVGAGFSILL
jgi:hypothetical protein